MNSCMIVTEPLPAGVWEQIGWAGPRDRSATRRTPTCTPSAPPTTGSPSAGAASPTATARAPTTTAAPRLDSCRTATRSCIGCCPPPQDAAIDHAWSGVLAVPRDWCSTAGLDRRTGLGWAGGYVGHGVATTNLAGRTLRDLVLGRGHRADRAAVGRTHGAPWEPEPLRWLGVSRRFATTGPLTTRSRRPAPA